MKNKIHEFLAFFSEKHSITEEDVCLFFREKDFNVGDYVKIIDRLDHENVSSHVEEIGYIGYITEIDDDPEIPICINRNVWVSHKEIELA